MAQNNLTESKATQYILIGSVLIFLSLILIIPLITIFIEALANGWAVFQASLVDADALSAIKLTLITAFIILPINTVIGLSLAWLLTRFDFKGKTIITTLLDLPFAISPIVAGLMLVLLFGKDSLMGSFFASYDIKIIYAVPGVVIATLFITFPFIARELIPLMQAQGSSDEQAALVLGANPWQTFWQITLPNIKWALLYGMIITNARAMGEFGAVSMVSGHIRGMTNTIPLQVEILYNEYNFVASFALASLLSLLALFTIVIQHLLSWRQARIFACSLSRHN